MPSTLSPTTTFNRVSCSEPHDSEVVSVKAVAQYTFSLHCDDNVTAYVGDDPPATVHSSGWTMNGTGVCTAHVCSPITTSVRAP